MNYRFTGFLDEIYATLVVRLHHSDAFEQDKLWCYAADLKTNAGLSNRLIIPIAALPVPAILSRQGHAQ